MKVFILYFVGPRPSGSWSGKFLGVYSSQRAAALAVERLQSRPEYGYYPKGFQVECVEVDEDRDESEKVGPVPPTPLPFPWQRFPAKSGRHLLTNLALDYDFLAPHKIVFGWGRRREIGSLARSLGRRAFLVSGLPEGVGKPIIVEIGGLLRAEAIEVAPIATLSHEPEVADVDRAAAQLRALNAGDGDFIFSSTPRFRILL